jgi:hypothetical protein
MTATAPTFPQIKAQVAAIRRKVPDARVIGIRSSGRWTAERTRRDGDETYLIEQCDSPLAVRIALRGQDEPRTTKVVITSLDEKELGDDILVRLAKRQLFPVDPWQIVKSLFQAHAIDPRLTRQRWIADSLIEVIPDGGYPSAVGGFLDAESVWSILLERILGLRAERPDLLSILRWSIDPAACERYRVAQAEFREAASAWLAELAGPAVEPVLRCIERNPSPDAVPIGLAASVVFNPRAGGTLERATGKMEERYFGGKTPEAFALERWAAAATEVVRTQITDLRVKGALLQRADEILKEVGAQSRAHLSATSPLGFNQRLEAFGKRLIRLLEQRQYDDVDGLLSERAEIGEHELAARERRRLERTDMAIRLLRWLSSLERAALPRPRSLAEAAEYHLREGGYADWARLSLRLGDPIRELSEAYSLLFERVTEVREGQSRDFAELLRLATEAGSYEDALVPVERILDRIVAPLAEAEPVLLIVIDGMSVAVGRELLGDIVGQDWIPVGPEHRGSLFGAGLATIPSVTEVSRTSLLCGGLRPGSSADERAGFAAHPALRAASRAGHPPVLFHKASLQDEGDAVLAAEVRAEIASAQRRVVGVVINAVDDQLLKGEQLDTRWTRDAIPVLPALLHEAKVARRLVVLLSDHGHVLDARTKGLLREGGERWRLDDGRLEENELRFRGSRVVIPDSKTLVAPWSERVRYGVKKNGYHGGATPQEMVIPIAVLSPSERLPTGWAEVPVDAPAWWEDLPRMAAPPADEGLPSPAKQATPKASPKQTNLLFDREEEAATHAEHAPAGVPVAAWVSQLLASPVFGQQRKLAGRSAPPEHVFGALLAALDQRGGKMTSTALARAMNYPALRLRGLIAVAQRVLNIDGYSVLSRDEASDTVELNWELLKRQFDLE